jgi:hypothetical protein
VPFPVLLLIVIRSRFQAKPATLLIPIDFFFPFRGGGALRYSVPKWLLFLNNVESCFHCLRNFFFSFLLHHPKDVEAPSHWRIKVGKAFQLGGRYLLHTTRSFALFFGGGAHLDFNLFAFFF